MNDAIHDMAAAVQKADAPVSEDTPRLMQLRQPDGIAKLMMARLPRPPGLMRDVPQMPGEVVFAKTWTFRERRNPVLVVALTRAEAEDRHRNGEDCVLAARLPGGQLVLLRQKGTDRHDPSRAEHRDPNSYEGGFLLRLHGTQLVAQAYSSGCPDADGMVNVDSLRVDERESVGQIWVLRLNREKAEVAIWDRRGGDPFHVDFQSRTVTDAEMNQFRCRMPGFGEFDAALRFVLDVLRSEGYGELE